KKPGGHDGVLFSRMWQFPAVEVSAQADASRELAKHLWQMHGVRVASLQELPAAGHTVTYRKITLLPFLGHVNRLPKSTGTHSVPLDHLRTAAVSSATRKIAAVAMRSLVLPSSRSRQGQEGHPEQPIPKFPC
ncbi:MAG: hypothetical protein ACRD4K_09750, partial [Candidatus Acidiferrales bacterium]